MYAARYALRVIQTFRDSKTQRIWERKPVPSLHPDVQRATLRKLVILDAADNINDLRVPPGNRLEHLRGDREGQHSIRINDQWRICFTWTTAGPEDVEFTDYH